MFGDVSAAFEELAARSEIEPYPEIPSKSEIEPYPEIPSKSEIEPDPETPSKSKRKVTWRQPDAESERWSDSKSDDGQSLYGKNWERWTSEQELLDALKDDPHVRSLSDVSIFKIPDFLKDTKREAYVPRRVLLGPYHHGRKKVRAVDIDKKRALRGMKTKFNKEKDSQNDWDFAQVILENPNKDLDFAHNVMQAILKNDVEIRDSYEESIDGNENSLAVMLSLDGCFVLKVLKDLQDPQDRQEHGVNNPLCGDNEVFASNALKDILMLENQIPWIVLLELLRLENPKDGHVERTLLNLMVKGTCGLFEMSDGDRTALLTLDWLESPTRKVRHLLDFVHMVIVCRPDSQAKPRNRGEHRISIERCIGRCLQMPQDKSKAPNQDFKTIPPAVELKNAGIKFRPCSGGIKQIRFDPDSSTIYLPLLSITSDTEVLFRNLIALEMCRPSELSYVCSYVNLVDDLIDSQNDVAFLRSMGILTNLIGSDKEVADLFNGLFKGVIVRKPIFEELRKGVNKNYTNKTRVRLEELWRDHFSSPWKTIALLVGFAILCLNLIQTVCTVIQTIHTVK